MADDPDRLLAAADPRPSATTGPAPGEGGRTVLPSFRLVPRTGVIFVTGEAMARGYRAGAPEWCNLGQGQPEAGPLPGAPPRIDRVDLDPADHEYAPVAGRPELREAVADYYNAFFRKGMASRYSAENVLICPGGRPSLTRLVASLGNINLGHFLPDYTAYEELLDLFRPLIPIPILLDPETGYAFSAADLERELTGRGLGAALLSNPSNPTGRLVWGETMHEWVQTARRLECTLLLDEFYSHYVWAEGEGAQAPVSAARWVEDVDRDPVLLCDGLTKNWRYPGWRVSWVVGPKSVIASLVSAASFLDGGANHPLQKAALPLLEPDRVRREVAAIHAAFRPKRELMLRRLRRMGLRLHHEPEGTFYVFASVEDLPPPLNDGLAFFGAGLAWKVITVPGLFFDVNPGRRRATHCIRFHRYVRFSFGPPMEVLERGLDRLESMIRLATG